MKRKEIHEEYHVGAKLQKKVISYSNFTYRNIINILRPYLIGKRTVLDIGCGTGTLAFYLASKGSVVRGIDLSETAISIARKSAEVMGLEEVVKFDVSDFPNKSIPGRFDLVLATEVLEHLQNDRKALVNINKALKKKGLVLFSVPSIDAPLYRIGLLSGFDQRVGHLRRYSKEGITGIIRHHGFKIIEIREAEGFLRNLLFTNNLFGWVIKFLKGPLSDLFAFIDTLTIPIFGPSQVIIIARK